MTRCYVSVGSNIDRKFHIDAGLHALKQAFGDLIVSSVYETEPVGFSGDPFYNMVIGFDTDNDVKTVAQKLRAIEIAHGRSSDSKKFSSRKLDLDLILFGKLVVDDGNLQIPRSDIEKYAFVLEPLAEIAPALKHPVLNMSYLDLSQKMRLDSINNQKIIKL